MSIFNFFRKKNECDNAAIKMLPVLGNEGSAEGDGAKNALRDEYSKNQSLTVSYATGWPIDVIYGYLHKNYEDKGFNDAMIKSDLSFRDMNLNLIRNKIQMVFREIKLNYNVMRSDLQTRLNTCKAAGLITTISELENRMSIIDAHIEEMEILENDFMNSTNEASIPLQSYNCGFLRGIATIAMSSNQQNISMPIQKNSFQESQVKETA